MPSKTPVSSAPPTHLHIPDGAVFTIADEIADLMVAVGYQVDTPERLALHAMYAQKPNGDWWGLESGVVCPRQNLKTSLMMCGALHDTFVQGVERVLWTAHEFKTSAAAFLDLREIIESNPWLDSEVLRIRTANGKEGFELRNGSRLDIIARSDKSGRGLTAKRLYMDEALYLMAKMMGALVPTMSAMRNAHIVYGSSPGIPASAVLRGLRDRGRAGGLGWVEWSNDRGTCQTPDCQHIVGTPGCWLDDMDAVKRVNPAYPRRITLDYLHDERRALERVPDEYLRERMGVWQDPIEGSDLSIFPAAEWGECLDEDASHREGADLVLAVDVSWDRTMASIAVAEVATSKTRLVQQIAALEPQDVREFLRSRVDRLKPLAIVLQANGAPASTLLQDIEAIGVPVKALHGGEMAKAAGHLVDAIRSQQVRHVGQSDLDQAINTAVSRPLGDGWAIDRKKSPTNVAGLVAVSEALWVLDSLIGSADYDVTASVH